MTSATGDTSSRTAVASRPLLLAPGTELLGEFQDSAYETPRYLVRRADGQVMQLPHLLYRLAASLDGRDADVIAADLSSDLPEELTPEQVQFLVDERLTPVGIVAQGGTASPGTGSDAGSGAGEPEAPPVKADPLLALRYRVGLVPASITWRVAGLLRLFFARPVWITLVGTFLAVHLWVLGRGELLDRTLAGVHQLAGAPALLLVMYAVQAASASWHECGHVTACRYGGARPGDMGVGLYLVWPAFYSTVTDSYRLSRTGRLRTDLGGTYFDAVFMTVVAATYLATGQPWILIMLTGMLFETAWQFLPSIRLDGYYILADLVGVPDLFGYLGPALTSLVPGRPTHPKMLELRPRARRIILAWVALSVPTLLVLAGAFLYALPQVLPVVWQGFQAHLADFDAALRARDVVAASLSAVEVLLLLLPWLGFVLIWVMLWTSLRKVAAVRWGWGWTQPASWAVVRGSAAAVAAAGAGVLVVWRVAATGEVLPPTAAEPRIGASALSAVTFGADGAAPAAGPGNVVVSRLLSGYAGLTGSLGRHPSVLVAGRELAVVAVAVLVACAIVFAVQRRVRPLALVLPLLAVAAMGPSVSALGVLSPAVVGAAWTATGLLVVSRACGHRHRRPDVGPIVAGVVAVAVGLAVAPIVVVPLASAGAVLLARRSIWRGLSAARRRWTVVGAAAGTALGLVLAQHAAPPAEGTERTLVLLLGAAMVAGGSLLPRLRPWAGATAGTVLAGALPWSGAGGALPLVVVTVVPLGVLLVQEVAGPGAVDRPHPLRRAAAVAPALLVTLVGSLVLPADGPALPHGALASWVTGPTSPTTPTTRLTVPTALWPDLVRDGVPADRLGVAAGSPGAASGWEVVAGTVPPGQRPRAVARFGTGAATLTVLGPSAGAAQWIAADRELSARQSLGALLADSPRLTAPPDVIAALRRGDVDSRVLLVLAGLTAQHSVGVESLPVVAGEDPALVAPHAVVLAELDGRPATDPAVAEFLGRWVTTQQGPLAPVHATPVPAGQLVQWGLPAPASLLSR